MTSHFLAIHLTLRGRIRSFNQGEEMLGRSYNRVHRVFVLFCLYQSALNISCQAVYEVTLGDASSVPSMVCRYLSMERLF